MKRLLVTGGSRGLGAAVVQTAVKEGWQPYVIDQQPPAEQVPWTACDLADTRAAEAATVQAIASLGGLDAVVTAAGVDMPGRLVDIPAHRWEQVVTVDLLATAAVVRAAVPALTAAHGHVVTVSSTLGFKAVSDATAYCAAKFGVVGFTRALAAELAGEVDVTLLVPGGMRTQFFDGRQAQYQPPPQAALNDPANVATAVMFALSQPPGCAVRELVVCPDRESSYP